MMMVIPKERERSHFLASFLMPGFRRAEDKRQGAESLSLPPLECSVDYPIIELTIVMRMIVMRMIILV